MFHTQEASYHSSKAGIMNKWLECRTTEYGSGLAPIFHLRPTHQSRQTSNKRIKGPLDSDRRSKGVHTGCGVFCEMRPLPPSSLEYAAPSYWWSMFVRINFARVVWPRSSIILGNIWLCASWLPTTLPTCSKNYAHNHIPTASHHSSTTVVQLARLSRWCEGCCYCANIISLFNKVSVSISHGGLGS